MSLSVKKIEYLENWFNVTLKILYRVESRKTNHFDLNIKLIKSALSTCTTPRNWNNSSPTGPHVIKNVTAVEIFSIGLHDMDLVKFYIDFDSKGDLNIQIIFYEFPLFIRNWG